jgi:hypothetical protein
MDEFRFRDCMVQRMDSVGMPQDEHRAVRERMLTSSDLVDEIQQPVHLVFARNVRQYLETETYVESGEQIWEYLGIDERYLSAPGRAPDPGPAPFSDGDFSEVANANASAYMRCQSCNGHCDDRGDESCENCLISDAPTESDSSPSTDGTNRRQKPGALRRSIRLPLRNPPQSLRKIRNPSQPLRRSISWENMYFAHAMVKNMKAWLSQSMSRSSTRTARRRATASRRTQEFYLMGACQVPVETLYMFTSGLVTMI